MNKREEYVPLELSGERLNMVVTDLRDKLLLEFWSHVPEGAHREKIKARLEQSIHSALNYKAEEVNAT